jgi:hypothetical protein
MPLTRAELLFIQNSVQAASNAEREEMRLQSEETLAKTNILMSQEWLSREDNKPAELAIETLVRLETISNGKGWWYRAKRRLQLTQMYLGS